MKNKPTLLVTYQPVGTKIEPKQQIIKYLDKVIRRKK